jgi:hypothetical protein
MSKRRGAHDVRERRACGDRLGVVVVVLAGADEPKHRLVLTAAVSNANCLDSADEGRCRTHAKWVHARWECAAAIGSE